MLVRPEFSVQSPTSRAEMKYSIEVIRETRAYWEPILQTPLGLAFSRASLQEVHQALLECTSLVRLVVTALQTME